MPRIPSLPNVYKRKRKYPNGEIKDSSTYYFKAVVNGKRTDVNTKKSNKRDAETQMRSWFDNHSISVEGKLLIRNIARTETITDVLRREGWFVAGTNPKLKKSRLEQKNYGIAQAKKIADALNHIFVEIEDLNKFESFLKKKEVLKDARFDDFVNFLAKPFFELTKRDADRFLNFLYEYTEWEKKNNRKAKDEYFICKTE